MRKIRYISSLLLMVLVLSSLAASGEKEPEQDFMMKEMDISGPPITTVPGSISDYEEYPVAVFAGGCFWGVESLFEGQRGVLDAVSGYTGGTMEFPTYQYVLTGKTGHVEAVAVFYDPEVTDYRTLAKYFFEIHDPTQVGGQGPDIGSQYESVVFYGNVDEESVAKELIQILEGEGYDIATRIEPRTSFYRAEGYHQDYYASNGSAPYCHVYTKRFPD